MNSLFIIQPYKPPYSPWIFDQEEMGIKREPFVMSASEALDRLSDKVAVDSKRFNLIFSENKFPNYQTSYSWIKGEAGGNWYQEDGTAHEFWLCPVLLQFFPQAPKQLYAKAEKPNEN